MSTFLVVRRQTGPAWDPSQPLEGQSAWVEHAAFMDGLVNAGVIVLGGPIGGGPRVLLVVDAASADEVRATLARDPWTGTHLEDDTLDRWNIRLDGRATPA